MVDQLTTTQLRASGKRALNALLGKAAIAKKDFLALPEIIEYSNRMAIKLFIGYAIGGVILVSSFVIALLINANPLADWLWCGIIILMICGGMHFAWNSSGGRDCYALQILNLLKCKQCKSYIHGLDVQKFVDSSTCPSCGAELEKVLQIELVPDTLKD